MEISTYLYFNGNCEAAFKRYETVLHGKILMMLRYKDAPTDQQIPPGASDRIMHARLQVGDRLLMGSDYPPERDRSAAGVSVIITLTDAVEADRIFYALAEGGKVSMLIGETFFAHRFGMLEDRFGIPWMVSCEKAMTREQGEVKEFVISRTFDAPRDLVWKAFTDPDRMKHWWGPKGVTILASKMDLRPAGTYHYGMRTPDGTEIWGRFVYREIAAPQRLVCVNAFSDADGGLTRHPMAPSWPLEMLSRFEFTEAAGKTTFTVKWSPLNPTPEERATFENGHESMNQGWSGTMDKLANYLAKV